LVAPVANFPKTFAAALLEQSDAMTGVLKLMNVSPYFSQPMLFVHGRFAAGGTTGVKPANHGPSGRLNRTRQLNEHAAHFLNILVGVDDVLVAKQKSESELAGLGFGFSASLEGSVFRS